MKVVVISVPIMRPRVIQEVFYPVDGNKDIEYGKPVCCPINGVLAKTMQKGETVKVIYIMTTGPNSPFCEEIKERFRAELDRINKDEGIGADIKYETVEMKFDATRHTHNKLITDLVDKIPENAEIYADITYGFKTENFAFICALRFIEAFKDVDVKCIIYGKLEKDQETLQKNIHVMLYDITTLYYLFKMIGSIENANAESASKLLKDIFAL